MNNPPVPAGGPGSGRPAAISESVTVAAAATDHDAVTRSRLSLDRGIAIMIIAGVAYIEVILLRVSVNSRP